MPFYTSPIACVILALIIVLHILSVIFDGHSGMLIAFVNISLHIALAFVMLLSLKCELVWLALVFMISVFTLSLASYIKWLVFRRRADKETENDL